MLIIILIVAAVLLFMKGGTAQAQQTQVVYRNAVPATSNKADGVIGAIAQAGFQTALDSLRSGDTGSYPDDSGGDDYSDIADGSTDTL